MTDEKKAARQGGSYQNTHPYFSIVPPRGKDADAPFDAVAQTILGQGEARHFLRDLRDGLAAPDALFMRLREIADDAAKMRGFCRALQKYIERGSA